MLRLCEASRYPRSWDDLLEAEIDRRIDAVRRDRSLLVDGEVILRRLERGEQP